MRAHPVEEFTAAVTPVMNVRRWRARTAKYDQLLRIEQELCKGKGALKARA